MPIKGLTDRGMKFPTIGTIRKGMKIPSNNGGERPVDLEYFRVQIDELEPETAAKFLQVYGPAPTDLNVVLPFNDIVKVWDAYYEAYQTGRMIGKSDGEKILYLVDPATGEVLAKNGFYVDGRPALHDDDSPYVPGVKDHKGRPIKWGRVGRMNVVIPELRRAAYLTVLTGSAHDIVNISDQLRAIASMNGGVIAGVPLVLRRRPVKISAPVGTGNQRKYVTKWLLSVEADPKWMTAKLSEMNRLALPQVIEEPLELPAGTFDVDIIDDEPETDDWAGPLPSFDETEAGDLATDWAGMTEAVDEAVSEDVAEAIAETRTAQVTDEAQAAPQAKMTLEQAMQVTTSKGLEYGQATTATLVNMSKAINTKLMALNAKGRNIDEDDIKEIDRLTYKLDAIRLVLTTRKE